MHSTMLLKFLLWKALWSVRGDSERARKQPPEGASTEAGLGWAML